MKFQPKARLLLQLGDQLIRSESIALLELIKNSYDAYAENVYVEMNDTDSKKLGEISIEDDGDGMNADIIKNVWMQPGSSYKKKIVLKKRNLKSKKKRILKKKNRIPLGEKGIGRFGVHKLGLEVGLTSKMKNSNEVYLKIDWTKFDTDDLLEDIELSLIERKTPKFFTDGATGTLIEVRNLNNTFNKKEIRELHRSVNSLSTPFSKIDKFEVHLLVDRPDWLEGLLSFKEIEEYALYYASAKIEGDEIKKIDYEFRPWDVMTKLRGREKSIENIRLVQGQGKKKCEYDLSDYDIGTINFKVLIFDRTPKILSLAMQDKKGFKDYLNANGGIRVFRDGIRVYDYGEPGNDWLKLDLKRVNQPGKTLSNNLVIGAVELDRLASKSLKEKTNREGFVENDAYYEFVSALGIALDKILTQRNIDKDKVRKFYSPQAVNQPVIGNINILRNKIVEEIEEEKLQNDLLKSVKDIEDDYKIISEIYTRSSSAGLSLAIVIHEIIHMVNELVAAMEGKPKKKYITDLVKTLQRTVSDYAGVIKQSPKTREDLATIINQALSNIQFRIKAHKIDITYEYLEEKSFKTVVNCSYNLILSTIINIIDNSIWWQNYARVKKNKLYIDIINETDGYVSVLIADNGPGFTIPSEEAIKPFVSDKPGGMGLGLHLAHEVMNAQKGNLSFRVLSEYQVPADFQNGAHVLLSFKR